MAPPMLDRPTALLWDNDGVLVDTEGLYFQATREVLATVGVELDEALYLQLFLREGRGAFHLARERGLDEAQIDTLRAARDARYAQLLETGSLLFAGVEQAVSALARQYRMAIVTSSLREHFQLIHRSTRLLQHFELVLTQGDYLRADRARSVSEPASAARSAPVMGRSEPDALAPVPICRRWSEQ
jgi:beta-phosphoglucomutase-like phosphatase (HAD superfamily)